MPYLRRIRSLVGHELLLLPSVTVLIFDPQDRLLLVKHAGTGFWVAPGGSIEPDESPEQAAVREVREETGCEVRLQGMVGVFGGPKYRVRYSNGDEVAYVMTVYRGAIDLGLPEPDGGESLDARWVQPRELADCGVAEWLVDVLDYIGWRQGRTTIVGGSPTPDALEST